MAIKKVKFCDNEECGKMIEPEKTAYWHFPFYGWHGKNFCSEDCLKKWVLKLSHTRGKNMRDIQI